MQTAINVNPSQISLNADDIRIKDAGGIITANDVEGALQENRLKLNAHIAGTADKHAADKINYSGNVTGVSDVKAAIDRLQTNINNISITGSQHDALVTAALIDVENENFNTAEKGYLNGRLEKWEQRTKAIENDIQEGKTAELIIDGSIGTLPDTAVKGQVSVVVRGYTGVLDMTWKQIQDLVRRGKHIDIFTIGDQFVANYNGVEYIWDVIGINHDIPTDKKYINSLTLQAHDCIMDCRFDAAEALYYAEEELAAGEHIFTLNNLKYKFTTTLPVPVGGQVYISSWEGDTYVPTKIRTYAADRTTAIESDLTVTATESGDDTLTPVNHHSRCRYGSNNYVESAIRQWLNSEASTFDWTPKTNFDRPPEGAPYTGAGFLKLLDPELVAVLGAVDKQVARNTITDGGGQDTFSDKVFLLSRVEVYGSTEGVTTGEKPYFYYASLVPAPTTDPLAGRIKYLGGSARTWWLRSPYVGYASGPRIVYPSGNVFSNTAHIAYGLAPACCIV